MESPSTSHHSEGIKSTQKVVNDEDDDVIYAFKRYVHVRKARKGRQTGWNYEQNEVDNRDIKGNESLYGVSQEIREAAERDRNRRRTRGGAVTYSDPLVTQTDGRSTADNRSTTLTREPSARSKKEEVHRSRDPQRGIYHPFYRDHKKRSQTETNLNRSKNPEESGDKGGKKDLRPASAKGHPTDQPTASLSGQSLSKYKKTSDKPPARRGKSASKKDQDDSGFMLIGGAYTNSL